MYNVQSSNLGTIIVRVEKTSCIGKSWIFVQSFRVSRNLPVSRAVSTSVCSAFKCIWRKKGLTVHTGAGLVKHKIKMFTIYYEVSLFHRILFTVLIVRLFSEDEQTCVRVQRAFVYRCLPVVRTLCWTRAFHAHDTCSCDAHSSHHVQKPRVMPAKHWLWAPSLLEPNHAVASPICSFEPGIDG